MSDVPYYLETRVRQALVRAHEVARLKGLTQAFDVDLFAAERAVRDLLGEQVGTDNTPAAGAGTAAGAGAAKGVLGRLEDLLARLDAAHDRGPQGADGPVGRAGRRSTRRR
jgi:hypothetical protein